ncbi:uncharacterized protein LOC126800217 [Argentina anserina]|uniref:uncharacterized protein LOC126800217 n=1 Tax=Argentina anserina TaxID=57926 RepID=UPI0021766EC5|nr:uncharacterized protein LOC126800217 [Potentilla anserina]
MASLLGGSSSAALVGLSKGHILSDMEDEEDLFEIDLEAVESIPPPQYNWDSYFTAAGDVLLANCLLPVTDISRAIPTVSEALAYKTSANVVMIPEPVPLGQLLRLPFLEAFGLHQKRANPQWDFVKKK